MTISAGTRLGSYEVLAPLGAGGMGEVYRARDPRLGREIALKVLPAEYSSDAGRLKRFEKEARSASALNHPNIVTIYEIGKANSHAYIAMELVKGKTLRELLFAGPLPTKRLLQVAAQIADGLARAHEAGIVHRDLKPENVMLTKDGRVKILDFGLAKLTHAAAEHGEGVNLPTESGTGAGVVLGTVGYMSPEQASGQPVDFRSDQFSFGSIVYEMVTGKRAFHKRTGAETLSAIIREDPEPIATEKPEAPAPLRWLLERCLSKDPEGRYASTKDLAHDLTSIQAHLSGAASRAEELRSRAGRRMQNVLTASLALAVVVLGALLLLRRPESISGTASSLRFQQVTFDEQTVMTARFAPDGETFVYGAYRLADREEKPAELFMARVGSPESRPLGIPESQIWSISAGGQMAFLLGSGDANQGTLAEAALAGGAPRKLLENIRHADWSPDGRMLAIVRKVQGMDRLEFPAGKVLYETPVSARLSTGGTISDCRVSPKGNLIAFMEAGRLSLVDTRGKVTRLSRAPAMDFYNYTFAWSPRGDEVWYAKLEGGATELYAVTPEGRVRSLVWLPGAFQLHDVSRNGRILLEKGTHQYKVLGRLLNDAKDRDLGHLAATEPVDLSADGRQILFNETESGWTKSTIYLRETGRLPVLLGRGFARALSPDGKWVAATPSNVASQIVLLPTGAGQPRNLPNGDLRTIAWVNWLPDGRRIVFAANAAGEASRLYVQDVVGGLPKPITPQGVTLLPRQPGSFVSPNGEFVVGWNVQGPQLYPIGGGDPRPVRGLQSREWPIQWTEDGRRLFVRQRFVGVFLLDPSSGERKPWMEFPRVDPTFILDKIILARNGKAYVRQMNRYSSNLFVLDGIH